MLMHYLPPLAGAAAATWLLSGAAAFFQRVRRRRQPTGVDGALPRAVAPVELEETDPRALVALAAVDHPDCRRIFKRALEDDDDSIRRAAVTGLGELARKHDWAVDALITALTRRADEPGRIAVLLAGLAPPARLLPLLGHPDETVRYSAVRLLQAAPERSLAREQLAALVADPSPVVRAAALAAVGTHCDAEALRMAIFLLDDPVPLVRAHACRALGAAGDVTLAPFLVTLLGDNSWWVREAAQEALREFGPSAMGFVVGGLASPNADRARGVALVLQDIGIVDSLVDSGHDPGLLASIYAAGGEALREAAEERAKRRASQPSLATRFDLVATRG